MEVLNVLDKLSLFQEHWKPKIIAQLNDYDIRVVKVSGEFVWHKHDDTDDFLLVLKGRLTIQMCYGDVELGPGELVVVPKGVEHYPRCDEEVHLFLIEPTGTPWRRPCQRFLREGLATHWQPATQEEIREAMTNPD